MTEQEKDDDERCPLCPSSGPPTRSTVDPSPALTSGDDLAHASDIDPPDLFWIACSKCSTWYHSCCLLLADEGTRASVPQAVREEVGKDTKGEGPFQDWTVWINRWSVYTRGG
jgi:F-box/leucine-rich repeat protein 10/11